MNLVVCPDRRSRRSSRASSIIDYGHEPLGYDSTTLQVQQLAAALQLVAPLGEAVRRLSMASYGTEERLEEGAHTGDKTDGKMSTSHQDAKS